MAYHLESRPRIFECAAYCGSRYSVTAGTILQQKTRTPLRKWFMAAYLVGHDKRGVSALFISRELTHPVRQRHGSCATKLRHALTESDTDFLCCKTLSRSMKHSMAGVRQKGNRGRAQTAGKAMVVCAVEKRPVHWSGQLQGHQSTGIHSWRRQDRRSAERHRRSSWADLSVPMSVPGTQIISDGFTGYHGTGRVLPQSDLNKLLVPTLA